MNGVVAPDRCRGLLRQQGNLGGLDELHGGAKEYEAVEVDKIPSVTGQP